MAVTFNPFTGNLDFIDTTAAAGSDTEIQFNDGGKLAGDDGLVFNKTSNKLTTKGDVELNDGSANTLTLQTVTPTAARTISFPDATGTVGLVAGSSGQLIINDSGAYAGVSTATVSSGNITLTGRFISSLNGAASAPPGTFTGTWFTGGTATTTKPQVLIEPTGATSTAWSTSGTGLGVNAASGFTGNLLDLQVNGTSQARITSAGSVIAADGSNTVPSFRGADAGTGIFFSGNNTRFTSGGVNRFSLDALCNLNISSQTAIRWSSSGTDPNSGHDVIIVRDAANTLAQRNGTNAQTTRVYNTFTSATNFERAKLQWDTNVLKVGTEKGADGGTARDMELQTDGTTRITLKANGAILFAGLPTSDPAVAGQLWNDGNTLKISAG
jgi:hypothetical protein